jgi:hypothetical protein
MPAAVIDANAIDGQVVLPAANPKIGELLGARQRPAERLAEPGSQTGWSAGGLEGDGVAEGFQLADVVLLAAFGIDALGVVAGTEVLKAGIGVR